MKDHAARIRVELFRYEGGQQPVSRLLGIRLATLRRTLICSILMAFGSSVLAQQADVPAGINSPAYSLLDENGVNLTSNKPAVSINDVSIGENKNSLGHTLLSVYEAPSQPAIGFTDSFAGKVQTAVVLDPSTCPGAALDVILAGSGDTMCTTVAGIYFPMRKGGSSMVRNGDGTLTYTNRDGSQFLFSTFGLLTQVTNPDGRISTLTYKSGNVGAATFRRAQSVTRNDGLQIKYTYASNTLPGSGYPTSWLQVASVTALNNAVDYCDPQADSCAYSVTWPVAVYSWTTSGALKYFTITDAGGQSTRLTIGKPTLTPGVAPGVVGPNGMVGFLADQLLAVRSPTSTSADTVTYLFCAVTGEYYCMHEGVKKVTANGLDWLYPGTSGSGGPSLIIQITASRPTSIGGSRITTQQVGNFAGGSLITYLDTIGKRTFSFEGSLANRLAFVAMGDGDMLNYAYDLRGNITQESHTPTTGSALQPTVRTANYDTTCANPVTCNKPNWVKDARGNQTDYKYDPGHGGTLKVTSPADASGLRPQIRNTYAQRYAWYKNASGVVVQSATPIWVLTTQKLCRKTAALDDGSGCSVAADEVTTTYEYGPTSGANNLFLRGTSATADGVTLRACYSMDIYGNRISETLPKAGLSTCP